MRVEVLSELPKGLPPPPIGQYGSGKLDLVAIVDGRVWACLMDNAAFCTQEFYFWDQSRWINKSVPADQGGDQSRVRVPYRQLVKLYERRLSGG